MSGKVLIVGDCLSSALESQGALHGYHALVSNTLEDAAEQIRTIAHRPHYYLQIPRGHRLL